MSDTLYDEILARQLAMNRQTWAVLQQHGVNEQSQLRLDFHLSAASKEAAEGFVAWIQEQTDYEVRIESSGSFFRRKWQVEGKTQKTTVSLEFLNEWVTWFVESGKVYSCEFGGWGAML